MGIQTKTVVFLKPYIFVVKSVLGKGKSSSNLVLIVFFLSCLIFEDGVFCLWICFARFTALGIFISKLWLLVLLLYHLPCCCEKLQTNIFPATEIVMVMQLL